LEQAGRSALAHHDHRPPKMGSSVLINAGWYKMHGPLIEWVRKLLLTKPPRLTTVALANKMARIAWAVMTRQTVYTNAIG
ncbi:hypothetical protein ACQZ57_26575, partial [Agrobacterium vitis]